MDSLPCLSPVVVPPPLMSRSHDEEYPISPGLPPPAAVTAAAAAAADVLLPPAVTAAPEMFNAVTAAPEVFSAVRISTTVEVARATEACMPAISSSSVLRSERSVAAAAEAVLASSAGVEEERTVGAFLAPHSDG